MTATLRAQQPNVFDEQDAVRARPLADDDRLNPGFVLGPLVALVLLAACANLGSMLLARGLTREREIATRIAVGASRWRLVRQLMTESLLLAALDSIAGLVVGRAGVQLSIAAFAGLLNVRVSTDLPVIVAAGLLSLISALAFGLAPALQLTSPGLCPGGPHHGLTGGPRHVTRSRQTLVAVQVATSCVLLILAGLMTRGAQRQAALAGSTDYVSLVVVEPNQGDATLTGPAARQALEAIAENIRQMPEVVDVTISADPIYGPSVTRAAGMPMVLQSPLDSGCFRVMQLALVQGRLFEPREPDAIVISRSAARAAFDGESPLGRVWNPEGGTTTGPTVVGVVESGALASLRDGGAVESYLPLTDDMAGAAAVMARTAGDGRPVLRRVRDAATLPGLTPDAWVIQTRGDQVLEHALAASEVIGALGATASLLAAFGIFGVMTFSARERTREIAIRLALGARARTILAVLLGQYVKPLGLGSATRG